MPLPMSVFQWKHDKAKEFLVENDYAALVVTTPANFYMFTGFLLDVRPWERPVAAVFPREGEPFLVMNSLSTNHLRMAMERGSLYVKDWVIYVEHHPYRNRTYTTPQWTELLAVKLKASALTKGVLAVEGSEGSLIHLKRDFPKLEFADATAFLVATREVKHPEELAVIRLAAELTDWGQDRYMEEARPGRLVAAVDFHVAGLMLEEAARRWPGRDFKPSLMGLSGPASASPHGTGTNLGVRFEKGHGVVNIVNGSLDGLTCENERTFFLGQPTDLQKRAFDAATRASLAAAEQMVAGNAVANIEAAAQAVIESAGFGENIIHRTGHGMGIEGHEFPANVAFNYRPLKENEVWSCEPGIFIYGLGGFRQDNTVIVGKERPEIVTKRSVRLEDQIIPV